MTKPEFPTADISKLDLDEWFVIQPKGAVCRRYPKVTEERGILKPEGYQAPPACLAWILAVAANPEHDFRAGDTIILAEVMMSQCLLEGFGYDTGEVFFLKDITEEASMHWKPKEKKS